MNSRRQAKKLMKAYGKELYKSRVEFMNSFDEEKASFTDRISYRHMLKRCVMTVTALTLTFSLCVMTASALGISLFGLERTINSDNDEYRLKSEGLDVADGVTDSETQKDLKVFYEPTYIPEGYELSNQLDLAGVSKLYIYTDGNYSLKIDVSTAESSTISVDNEHMEMREDVIAGKQIIIYDSEEEEGGSIYLMQEGAMVISITGCLPAEEFEKIIYGMEPVE